ncbi:DNA phosphorothioation-dependent restriction protein DptG [Halobacillus sp. SY10]|uniref:DNA phosphorothioation-dependent restriction protein DptG n=1 Tax=Halobacillus TaxID=45667 RepID=UPI000B7DDA4D|nr:DNA phosphorothioation-dependent restriction protein DptG [Halobacillus aidingensis]
MERLEELRKSLRVKGEGEKKELSHIINKRAHMLPFQTRNPERAKFKNGFLPVIGQFVRYADSKKLGADIDNREVIQNIKDKVRMDESDAPHFEKVLEKFLLQSENFRILHPFMLSYVPLSDSQEATGEKNIALYMHNALLKGDESVFHDILHGSEKGHVLTKLVRDHMPELEKEAAQNNYPQPLDFISGYFKEDLLFLARHEEYFLQHIELFLAYYYFFSISQLTLKLNQFDKAEDDRPTDLYYNLDWEASSRNRAAYKRGYSQVKESARNLLVHINTLEHLNFIFDVKNQDYLRLLTTFENKDENERKEVISALRHWIKEYSSIAMKEEVSVQDDMTVNDLMRELFKTIKKVYGQSTRAGTESRYALGIEEIGKRYFLKTRGALGHTLNVTQDFLLLMAALVVKDEKISLKKMFKELEKRGLFFDRQSQEEIQEMFDKLNLIEKKSDSGDAQYVKPIL